MLSLRFINAKYLPYSKLMPTFAVQFKIKENYGTERTYNTEL